jgi:hypothetical protein
MSVVKIEKYNTIEEFRVKTNLLSDIIGDQSILSTFSNNTDLISALRELTGTSKGDVAVKQIIEGAYGWTMTPVDISDVPSSITYTKNTDEVKCELTWNEDNNPTTAVYKFKSGSSAYSTIITQSIAYDSETGNVASITWSLG